MPSPKISLKPRPEIKPAIDFDRLFHALGDPTRRAILDRLSHGPLSVSALAAPLDITLTAVAQHLQILEESALVHTEKLGRVRTCRIDPKGFSAFEQWIRDHRTLWQRRLNQLSDLLAEPDEKA
ncbi:MAG: transcriptional regulator, ArsR family [Edaphobacter sp.]|jgi:DNA-binding transcriptional ArsR family regulator|nr:transcriptional regulator, ArsR family [Edaphobacter sp.]